MTQKEKDQLRMILIEKEVIEGLSTYKTQMTLIVQIFTVLVIANVSFLGFCVTSGKYGFMALGSIFPILAIFTRYFSFKRMVPILYCVYKFEKDLEVENMDFLAETYTCSAERGFLKDFDRITGLINKQERMVELKKLSSIKHSLFFSTGNTLMTLLCFFAIVFQLLFSILQKSVILPT